MSGYHFENRISVERVGRRFSRYAWVADIRLGYVTYDIEFGRTRRSALRRIKALHAA